MTAPALPDLGPEGSLKTKEPPPASDALAHSFLDNLFFVQGRSRERATVNDLYMALAHTVRDRLVERWISTVAQLPGAGCARGLLPLRRVPHRAASRQQPHQPRHLRRNRAGHAQARPRPRTLIEQEEEPGLGNGGLGRLASCFMDSLATLDIPAIGYGIRYEYGIFDQQIRDGWQVESTDKWLRLGNPWALERPEDAFEVKFGGHTETRTPMDNGRFRVRWIPRKAGARHSQRHAHPRLPHQHREHHAPVVRASRRVLQLWNLQHRRLLRRRRGQGRLRKHLQDSLSQR